MLLKLGRSLGKSLLSPEESYYIILLRNIALTRFEKSPTNHSQLPLRLSFSSSFLAKKAVDLCVFTSDVQILPLSLEFKRFEI